VSGPVERVWLERSYHVATSTTTRTRSSRAPSLLPDRSRAGPRHDRGERAGRCAPVDGGTQPRGRSPCGALARLDLSEDELELFTGQLASVLDYAADVAALDLTGVRPTAHPLPVVNVLRDDVVAPSLERDIVLAMAPSVEDDRFSVPRIVGEEP